MSSRLGLDNVGVYARTASIIGADTVVIERAGSQTGHAFTGHVADVQILVAGHVSHNMLVVEICKR